MLDITLLERSLGSVNDNPEKSQVWLQINPQSKLFWLATIFTRQDSSCVISKCLHLVKITRFTVVQLHYHENKCTICNGIHTSRAVYS